MSVLSNDEIQAIIQRVRSRLGENGVPPSSMRAARELEDAESAELGDGGAVRQRPRRRPIATPPNQSTPNHSWVRSQNEAEVKGCAGTPTYAIQPSTAAMVQV